MNYMSRSIMNYISPPPKVMNYPVSIVYGDIGASNYQHHLSFGVGGEVLIYVSIKKEGDLQWRVDLHVNIRRSRVVRDDVGWSTSKKKKEKKKKKVNAWTRTRALDISILRPVSYVNQLAVLPVRRKTLYYSEESQRDDNSDNSDLN